MITSGQQDRNFGTLFLGEIVEWIGAHFEPDDIFDAIKLEAWARNNDWMLKTDATVNEIGDSELETWAEQNGYKKVAE